MRRLIALALAIKRGHINPKKGTPFTYKLDTTQSWKFLNLNRPEGLSENTHQGRCLIIGVVDSGITPCHPSFSDINVIPCPTSRWKRNKYNNKLIDLKAIGYGYTSPLDDVCHGTHVASIATGNYVNSAYVFGEARGTAAGMAPLAHLISYKVDNDDVVTLFEAISAAVDDSVDVINISMSTKSLKYHQDPIAVGAFHAIEKGIVVCCSASNHGPKTSTVLNCAPWIITVGASSIGRMIRSQIRLGNNDIIYGRTAFIETKSHCDFYELVILSTNSSSKKLGFQGKVVMFMTSNDIEVGALIHFIKDRGGIASIIVDKKGQRLSTFAMSYALPSTRVSYKDAKKIIEYVKSTTTTPTVMLEFREMVDGVGTPPEVPHFSARGPSLQSPGIIKPDLLAPGVDIIGAVPERGFDVMSGTSMATPHVSGIATLLKASHPDWSPAAIRSAMMTTADGLNMRGKPILDQEGHYAGIFATGSGQVNATRANDPGIIFDIQPKDYISYMFSIGYSCKEIESVVNQDVTTFERNPEAQLNYPSYYVIVKGCASKTCIRTATNVGEENEVFRLRVDVHHRYDPLLVRVNVSTNELRFTNVNQKLTYEVNFIANDMGNVGSVEGSITWISDRHTVRTPFVCVITE